MHTHHNYKTYAAEETIQHIYI